MPQTIALYLLPVVNDRVAKYGINANLSVLSGLRHDHACLLVPSEREFAAILTILAAFVVRQSLKPMSEFQPPSFLRAWDTGVKFGHLAYGHHGGKKIPTAGVIIMKKFFFQKRFFSNVRSKNRIFGDTQNFGGRAPLGPPPPCPQNFFYIFGPDGVTAPHGRKYE